MDRKNKCNNFKVYQQAMAKFYDDMAREDRYGIWKELVADIVKKYNTAIDTCLDIACGTGNISKILIELGYRVVGVDISSEMISVAKRKFSKEKFICSDIRDFDLANETKRSISLVVSFYDSLNYLLSSKDILQAFKSVSRNVSSGTIFLFDMNSMDHIKTAQKFRPQIFEGDEFFAVFRYGGKDELWVLDIDLFAKEGNYYRLTKERHIERGYDKVDIERLLNRAKFNLLETREEYKMYEDNKEHLSRIYFIAQKL